MLSPTIKIIRIELQNKEYNKKRPQKDKIIGYTKIRVGTLVK